MGRVHKLLKEGVIVMEDKYLMEQAVIYFKEEIRQIDIILGGIHKKDYVKYLNNKRDYYELSLELIEDLL